MKSKLEIYSSNLPNKYDIIMPTKVLFSALHQKWNTPTPCNIGHDRHRPVGYNLPSILHIQPNLSILLGHCVLAENDADMTVVKIVCEHSIAEQIHFFGDAKIQELKTKLGDSLSKDAKLCSPSSIAYEDKNVVERVFPHLLKNITKDGLIPIKNLTPVSPGVFKKEGFLLFAHNYFRRSLSIHNTLNEPFLRCLQQISELDGLTTSIAIDRNLIGLAGSSEQNIELQYWWGPTFDNSLKDIKLGVTCHKGDSTDEFFNAVDRTEFWWYEQDDRKTFECEEVRPLDMPSCGHSTDHFGSRFIHSILDQKSGIPIHLDGAIRLYDEDLMLERVDKDILQFGRKANYTKLWRIDGKIPIDKWKELITHYYRDNHLIGEYFGAKKEENSDESKAELVDENSPINKFIPLKLSKDDGLQVSLSIRLKSELEQKIQIIPTEQLTSPESKTSYVEPSTIDIMKLFKRDGKTVELVDSPIVVAFDDLVHNLSEFSHRSEEAVNDAIYTQQLLLQFFKKLQQRDLDRIVNWHISIRYDEFDVQFSFLGPINSAISFLMESDLMFPNHSSSIGHWTETVQTWLSNNYPIYKPRKNLFSTLFEDGMLIYPRVFVTRESIQDIEPPMKVLFKKTQETELAKPLLEQGTLKATSVFIVKESQCMVCNTSYFDCDCIRMIDQDVRTQTTKAELFGVLWTDRSAW